MTIEFETTYFIGDEEYTIRYDYFPGYISRDWYEPDEHPSVEILEITPDPGGDDGLMVNELLQYLHIDGANRLRELKDEAEIDRAESRRDWRD